MKMAAAAAMLFANCFSGIVILIENGAKSRRSSRRICGSHPGFKCPNVRALLVDANPGAKR